MKISLQTPIRYKGIVHNVLNDAPFIGAIVIANACHRACPNCINEHLKTDAMAQVNTAGEILNRVCENGLNQGVIFSGLEWTEQPDDLRILVKGALERGLEVMIYTHQDEHVFLENFSEFIGKPIYVKFGFYDETVCDNTHTSFGVYLASKNQYIKFLA
ncbi:hypothetical protein [Fusibacter tunisiensis]|uniref:Organic radical activating enzyme n=1 Tax=Fusibacter tunisiensis TaxID=1008308 RepID=A0ABS2MP24_9FIRM|nr:hypothetical protein [Fusibacter tunisiensis]MBM7561138.1 organic radical activating enzyme [Fusibacter tunisiensis]